MSPHHAESGSGGTRNDEDQNLEYLFAPKEARDSEPDQSLAVNTSPLHGVNDPYIQTDGGQGALDYTRDQNESFSTNTLVLLSAPQSRDEEPDQSQSPARDRNSQNGDELQHHTTINEIMHQKLARNQQLQQTTQVQHLKLPQQYPDEIRTRQDLARAKRARIEVELQKLNGEERTSISEESTDSEIRVYAKKLYEAIQDTSNILDTRADGARTKRVPVALGNIVKGYWSAKYIEEKCWEVVLKCVDSQLVVLTDPNRTPSAKDKVAHENFNTWQGRCKKVIEVCRESKSACKSLLDADYIDRLVDAPQKEIEMKRNNLATNGIRNAENKAGKRVVEEDLRKEAEENNEDIKEVRKRFRQRHTKRKKDLNDSDMDEPLSKTSKVSLSHDSAPSSQKKTTTRRKITTPKSNTIKFGDQPQTPSYAPSSGRGTERRSMTAPITSASRGMHLRNGEIQSGYGSGYATGYHKPSDNPSASMAAMMSPPFAGHDWSMGATQGAGGFAPPPPALDYALVQSYGQYYNENQHNLGHTGQNYSTASYTNPPQSQNGSNPIQQYCPPSILPNYSSYNSPVNEPQGSLLGTEGIQDGWKGLRGPSDSMLQAPDSATGIDLHSSIDPSNFSELGPVIPGFE